MPTLIPVLFDGGGGINTLEGPDTANTWNIATVNGGTLNPSAMTMFRFGNVQNLQGGTGADTFNVLAGGSIGVSIDGGGGDNVLSYASRSTPVTFNLQTSSDVDFVGFGTAVGGLFNVLTLVGSSSGNDTLVGFNAANTFNITGQNAGNVTATINSHIYTEAFSGFENLTGRAFDDNFIFSNTAGVTGTIRGGAGTDTLDFSAYTTAVSINLQTKMFLEASAGRFAGIENFIGSTANTTTLIGSNTVNKWSITSTNAGTLNAAGTKFSFSSMANLTGGNLADTFLFSDGANVTGTVNGGSGTDTLDLSAFTSAVTVNLQTNTATAMAAIATFSNIERLIGGMSDTDTLVGTNAGSTWNITGNNAGSVGTLSFKGIENLTGGTGGDTFALANGKGISGKINGGGGTGDELNYSAYTTTVSVNLTTGAATNIFGGAAGGVTGIADVFGGSVGDTLIGNGSDNFLFGNGGNDMLDGMGGNNVLVGGSGNDTLQATGSTGRNILLGGLGADHLTGGAGDDILINGVTSFDTNVTTLNSIYTFWIGAGTFTTRVNALRAGTATGVSIALDSTNVFNDGSTDTMTGNPAAVPPPHPDSNWFFAKLFSPNKDHITDQSVNDAVN